MENSTPSRPKNTGSSRAKPTPKTTSLIMDNTITSLTDGESRSYYYQEELIDLTDVQNALTALTADSFTTEAATGKKEISLTVTLDLENTPSVQMEFYQYDGSYCLAVVDGEPVSLVARSSVVDLVEAVNAIVLN